MLLLAYSRRKQFEHRALAIEIVNVLGEAMGAKPKGGDELKPGTYVAGHRVVDPDTMLRQIGAL